MSLYSGILVPVGSSGRSLLRLLADVLPIHRMRIEPHLAAIPSAGMSGLVLRARLLGKRGYSLEASAFSVIMETIWLTMVFALVYFFGLTHLIQVHSISSIQIILVSILCIAFVSLFGVGYWIGKDRQRLVYLVTHFNALENRVRKRFHRPLSSAEAALQRIDYFYSGLQKLGRTPLWPFIALAVARVALDIAALGACFHAFQFQISMGILVMGYGLMLFLSGPASLPGGLGLADASLAIIYSRLGAPGAVAIAAALAYRLIAFWFIRLCGFFSWVFLEAQKKIDLTI